MVNRPQREHVKKSVKIDLDNELCLIVSALAEQADCSTSSIVESILLLAKLIHIQEEDDAFVCKLRDIKAQHFASMSDLRNGIPTTRKHFSIDQDAIEFVRMLSKTYRPVFASPQEAAMLCIAWAKDRCKSTAEVERFLRRLESIQLVYPKHKKGTP